MYGTFYKKRFVVFGIFEYERSGGMDDVIGTFHTLEEARDLTRADRRFDYHSIFDLELFNYIEDTGSMT